MMEQIIAFLKLFEIPGLMLSAVVIYFLFRIIDRIEDDRSEQLASASNALLELAKAFEKLSTLIETLVRRP